MAADEPLVATSGPNAAGGQPPCDVLVVEDDAAVRLSLAGVLEGEGWSVRAAADGAEALALLRDGLRPRLVLLDLLMPVLHGWGLMAEIRSDPKLRSLLVVTLSGSGPIAEADGHLAKPAGVEDVLAVVELAARN